jgi:hypothetical protein
VVRRRIKSEFRIDGLSLPVIGLSAMLPLQIINYLNKGIDLAAEVPPSDPETRCFVRIRAMAKPGLQREEYRYLNSRYSMWEYWDYEFRRMVLGSGWESDEWNYDRYLVQNETIVTRTEAEFFSAMTRWLPEPERLQPVRYSACPE